MDNGCRGREKIVEEADRNFRERGNGKEDRNNCI